ncbi:MAG: hypothetical protein LBQ79_04625 [Deltaproteobacteria bacterium]|jgi:transposase|nr:hypothetical protein [Deltaproteobacteria bacterium]
MAVLTMMAQSLILPFCLVIRAWIVILSHAGKSNDEIAASLNLHRNTVGKLRRRFIADWLKGLDDVPRSGRTRTYDHDKVRNEIMKTLGKPQPKRYSQWEAKAVAAKLGVSEDIVGRILRANHTKFCRTPQPWCVSTDASALVCEHGPLTQNSTDVVTLYMYPQKNSSVITVDEKPGIQAVERPNGYVRTRTGTTIRGKNSTYERCGTMTNLFDAADIKKRMAWIKTYEGRGGLSL